METQEILNGNKLIAEFMGWKETSKNLKWISKYGEEYDNKVMFSGWIKEDQEYSDFEPLVVVVNNKRKIEYFRKPQYNSSWDWLIPVIDKITDMDIYFEYKDKTSGQFGRDEMINTKYILRTWENVVEFLEWYNKNK